ncbi:response regulator transcription factor [Thalassospiraceae bacterium LMO-JJ14]|nr:response regulator transcription factor [Thalassospiraceae bacterium LMO-JJ14]
MTVTAVIIDDEELMRRVVSAGLEQLDVSIVGETEDGRAGVDLVLELEPDLVLLDIIMPELNGYLALEEIIGRAHDPYVVMMTAIADEEVSRNCRLAGAQDYILKSAPMTETVERLSRHVKFLKSRK